MKSLGMRDCAGWYLDFMDEMHEFATCPADVETLKTVKSRLDNALLQVGELIQYENNKQAAYVDGRNAIHCEGVSASFKPLKPKKFKKIKSKLKKAHFKAGRIRSIGGQTEWAKQFSIEIKLGDRVVFSRMVPEYGSPSGLATLDIQDNLRVKEILQSALESINLSLGCDGYNFKP